MNGHHYRKELGDKSLPFIKKLYVKIFGCPPPSSLNKPDLIEKLGCKFDELYYQSPCFVTDEEEEEEKKEVPPAPKWNGKAKKQKGSRRRRIIEELSLGIWDTASLAEALNIENPKWKVQKNKTAIAGTLADLRKKRNLNIYVDKGRIVVEC